MDFLDPKKRRAHQLRLLIGYGLMAVAILTATLLLVYATSGIGYNRERGEIVQNGLVFVDAHPEKANIFINGEARGETDGRFILEEGPYSLELRRNGYATWKHDFELAGKSVKRFIYPFLYPEQVKSKDIEVFTAAPDMVSQSPDRKWIAMHKVGQLESITVIDTTTNDNTPITVTVPKGVFKAVAGEHVVSAVEWSTDNRHLLLKHSFVGGVEYIVFDRENPSASQNISTKIGVPIDTITLRDKKHDQYYVVSGAAKILYMADLKGKITEVASAVEAFFPYGEDMLLYVTPSGAASGQVTVMLKKGNDTYRLRSLPVSKTYLLTTAQFDGRQLVAVGDSTDSKLYVYENVISSLKKPNTLPPIKALLKVAKEAQYVSFSTNARFVMMQGGSTVAVYDAEENTQHRYDTGLALSATEKAYWMDGHRLSLVSGDKLVLFDFDNKNRREFIAAAPGYRPMFDKDYEALFTVSPASSVAGKQGIVRTELLVK